MNHEAIRSSAVVVRQSQVATSRTRAVSTVAAEGVCYTVRPEIARECDGVWVVNNMLGIDAGVTAVVQALLNDPEAA